jgi:hypothetical protein
MVVRFYLWLNKSFTEQIMFKNNVTQLDEIVKEHAAGGVEIKTELERMMKIESLEMIKDHYNNKVGKAELET